ncbi:hypothetical protein IWW48_002595 [Coemansia sp. RSA 1200]|nr:hypothetical protein IWW48_002595 [Coemansia sp. RSA 1200]
MFKSVSLVYALAVAIAYSLPVSDSNYDAAVLEKRHACNGMGCSVPGCGVPFLASGLYPNTRFIGPGFVHTKVYPDITFSAIHGGGGLIGSTTPPAPPAAPAVPAVPDCGQPAVQPCQEANAAPPAPAPPAVAPPAPDCNQNVVQPAPAPPAVASPAPDCNQNAVQPAPAPPAAAPPAPDCNQNVVQPSQGADVTPPAPACDQSQAQGRAGTPSTSYSFNSSQSKNVAASNYKEKTVYMHNKEGASVNASSDCNTNISYNG